MSSANTTASAVRAELARHSKTQADAAAVLEMAQASLNRRLMGHVPFTVPEITALAEWLGVAPSTFVPERISA